MKKLQCVAEFTMEQREKVTPKLQKQLEKFITVNKLQNNINNCSTAATYNKISFDYSGTYPSNKRKTSPRNPSGLRTNAYSRL